MPNRTLLLFFTIVALTAFAGAAQAQISRDPLSPDKSNPENDPRFGSPEREMRARLEIARAEKVRRENLDRAREVAQLGTELREAYSQHKAFERAEIKKLERLEKLTRRIRSEAGGSDDDEPMEKAPQGLDAALARIAELSAELRKGVEKTPRLVISASVIEHANQILELIGFVRTLSR
jgi:predicted transcriptional regulator